MSAPLWRRILAAILGHRLQDNPRAQRAAKQAAKERES